MKIDLVVTCTRARRDFPDAVWATSPNSRPNTVCASYEVMPDKCHSDLGRWLACHICTTRAEDDGSLCQIVLPLTETDLFVRELGLYLATRTSVRSHADAEAVFEQMLSWIEDRRRLIRCYGPAVFHYRTFQFRWPVYGATIDVDSVEAYFDQCATQIRQTDGVIWQAGPSRVTLPESLAQTMAVSAGGGIALLQRFLATPGVNEEETRSR